MADSKNHSIPPKYSRRFLEMHLDKAREIFWQGAKQDGIADYFPKNLERFDDTLSDIRVTFLEKGYNDPDLATLWCAYASLGSYFGDLLVNNLGGRWRYPNPFITILGLAFGRPDWIYRHWYVVVDRRKIPVFTIAMRRHTLGREKASLSEAYEEIARVAHRR